MPLVRFEVRNEYGLGSPELYKAKNFGDRDVRRKKKDNESKEILDGVAVAGLVGILRQLGDLAQLASDIFHDLHEQVVVTSARGQKLSNRVRNLEAEVPLVENAVKGQRSHIHYAYAAGCEYHANLQFEQSHLLSTDLPQYMMDSYEESRDPPRLYLLDKFDTSGSGACLKRYSDPSYFRTVWSASEQEKAVKVQRERKGHKIKRKGSELNEESRLGSSLSQHFSSSRFAYSNADEHHFSNDTSPVSTSRRKPDLESRPSSFDSRRLRFVEPIIDSNSSGLPDESEINSPCISKSHIIQGSTFASYMHDKANVIRTCPSPPSVRWDEKSEILKPISSVSCDDILMDDTQFKPTQISSDVSDIESDISEMEIPGNEITSETENYLDASTILESETETDSEYQTKREFKSAEHISKNMGCMVGSEDPLMPPQSYTSAIQVPKEFIVNQNANYDNVPNDTVCESHGRFEMSNADIVKGHQCLVKESKKENSYQLVMPEEGSESATPPCLTRSDQHPNYCISSQIKNENSFEFEAADDKPTIAGTCSKPINQISDSSSVKVEAAINQPPESNISNSTIIFESSANDSNSTASPPFYTSNIPTPKLWTNGILLGLAPSKPPVFSATDESNEVSASNTCSEYSPNKTILWNSSHAENANAGKSNNAKQNIPHNGFTTNHTKSMPSESSQSTDDIKSSLASLAQRILANGLQRTQSIAQTPSEDVVRDFNRPLDNIAESDACFPDENVSSDTIMQSNSQFSGNSSPPLEHMKISFHPMNGSEASNLKLEYATEDLTFPSFQLLPKSNNHLADNGSETDDDDDDTFCRSGHYTSEDHESNSEMWEQDDMTVYSNRDAYNDLDRTSLSSSSVSSFKGFFQGSRRKTAYEFGHLEIENSMQYPQNDNSLNIPGLDSFVLTSGSQTELPPPPPLPPMQWRTSKSSSDKKAEKDFSVAEIVEHFNDIFNDMHPQRFTADEQHERNIPTSPPRTMHNVGMLDEHGETNGNDVSSKQLELEEELSHKFDNQQDIQKISGHTQPSYIFGGQVVGEREDFLLQIRNKSFNLRRTSTTKSRSSVPQSTANINVAAILEKATAIRQAVVDSDGEDDDDNWSDS